MSEQNRTLQKQVDEIVGSAAYRHSFWGISQADSASGEILYEMNRDKLFSPASTAKLWSCAAALDAFGSEHRFVTSVYRRGELGLD